MNVSLASSELLDPSNSMPGREYINSLSDYTGYYGYEDDKIIRYVGTTTRDPYTRFSEHLRKQSTHALLNYKPVRSLSSKLEMRIWEQMNINLYGLQKNVGQLINLRHEISSKY